MFMGLAAPAQWTILKMYQVNSRGRKAATWRFRAVPGMLSPAEHVYQGTTSGRAGPGFQSGHIQAKNDALPFCRRPARSSRFGAERFKKRVTPTREMQ